MAQPRKYIEAPAVPPLPYGLMAAAVVLDDLEGHAQMGVQYEPESCAQVHETRGACDDAAASFDDDTGVPVVEGEPFNLYSLFRCNPVGLGAAGLQERAAQSMRLGESRGLELGVASRLPLTVGAVDLTPAGGAVHAITGLAMLEGWSAENYGGVPVIHVPRQVGTLLTTNGTVIRGSGRLETVQGVPVASGGGYADLEGPLTDVNDPNTTQPAGTDEAWLYVTGYMVAHRAPTVSATPLTMSRGAGLAGASNDAFVLAVRPYAVTWECITAAVLVSTTYDIPVISGGGA